MAANPNPCDHRAASGSMAPTRGGVLRMRKRSPSAAVATPIQIRTCGALPPNEEVLADQERTGDMPDALEEPVGRRHRIGADLRRQIGMRDMRHHRRIDEAVSDADDEDARDRRRSAEHPLPTRRRAHQPDEHQADPLMAAPQNRIASVLPVRSTSARHVGAGRDHADAVQHDDLADLLLPIPVLAEQQRQRESDRAGQDRLGGNADAEHRLEEFAAADDLLQVARDAPDGDAEAGPPIACP